MSASIRAAKLTKLHKSLKKLYAPVIPPNDRSVVEHLIYACCHENSPTQAADEAFARLQEIYYDWNEVRVTTVIELSEELSCLKNPAEAATRVRNTLNAVFETHYAWDLDFLKKENLGKALQKLDNYSAISPYCLAYVAQNALGGHSIPLDKGAMMVFYALEIVEEKEIESGKVTGLERAIPKNKGQEFASLIHQIGADLYSSPFGTEIRNKIIALNPDAKDRLPKRARPSKKEEPKPEPVKKAPKKEDPVAETKKSAPKKKTSTKSSKEPTATKTSPKKSVKSAPAKSSKKTTKKAESAKPSPKKKAAPKAAPKAAATKKTAKTTKPTKSAKAPKSSAKPKAAPKKTKKSSSSLAKKKPR